MTQFAMLILSIIIVSGTVTIAEAHPHTTFEMMESHSYDINDEGFLEHFYPYTRTTSKH